MRILSLAPEKPFNTVDIQINLLFNIVLNFCL